MTFRLKTIIGIAAIEAILLLILIWNALAFLHSATEDELTKRANTTAKLVATMSQDAVISTDLASLESFLSEVMENPGLVYVRIYGRESILAESGAQKALQKTFHRDETLQSINDGVFDTAVDIIEAGHLFGHVEVGIDVRQSEKVFSRAKRKISLIALVEMVLCGLFSFLLGSLLIRQLKELKEASERIAEGDLGTQVKVTTRDEIGQVAESFNLMAKSLKKDNAERLNAEKKLADEKEQLAVTLRSIGDGVITTNTSGKIVLLNKVAENLTGWSAREAAGRHLEEVFHIINEKTRETCENPVTKVVSSGQIVGLANHTILISRDGKERNIADSGAPILDSKSNIIGVVLVFRDVTEQIKTEKELLKVQKLESIGVLAGGIAHDFNNILVAILGNINLALFDKNLQDGTRKFLSEAEKASVRARDLTQQLLTFAKGGEPLKEISSLENVIKDSANFVLHGDKVASQFNIPEDLWLVDIDKGQISQVIQNIVLNASHAMPDGGSITITCKNVSSIADTHSSLEVKGRFVKIIIQDMGIGIPSKIVDKIFDPYFSTNHDGNGLGLAVTHSIINKHGGHISVESTPGRGSTFTIYLPASGETETNLKESFAVSVTSTRAKILIMDDEEIVRTVAKEMLVQLGHEVELSIDGEQVIRLYKKAMDSNNKFDFVIMDLTIPGGMGGKEAVQGIIAIDSDAKVIVSSGYSNDPIMANCKDYGFCAAIVKPFQLQDLSKVIGGLMG
jgi:PAS domain S-box-containing protein